MTEETSYSDADLPASITEDSDLGSIQINNQVVAMIVAMAAKEVPGVAGMATGGFSENLAGFFGGKKETSTGVSIAEDDDGAYIIGVKLILDFGVRLAKVAEDVQVAVRDQVQNMTNKDVARVDVIVDGVRAPASAQDETNVPTLD
jgi:uncharacterized alkaline shock family protein YloU